MVCDKVLCDGGGGGGGGGGSGGGGGGIKNQKQEPHTKMWGNNYGTNDKYGKVWHNHGPQKGVRRHQGVSPFIIKQIRYMSDICIRIARN